MRTFLAIGMIVVYVLVFFSAGSAEQIPDASNQTDNIWNGTWISERYSLIILQNGIEALGWYESNSAGLFDPGKLTGSISGDGKTFSGIWTETGPLTVVLSDDGMTYSGTGGLLAGADMNEIGTYSTNGTRMETSFDPDNIWTGTWKGKRTLNTWIQNGTSIMGSYHPLSGIDDESGLFEGTVSEDGKSVSGKWIENGNFTFILSEDGSFFNGTYTDERDPSGKHEIWNGIKSE